MSAALFDFAVASTFLIGLFFYYGVTLSMISNACDASKNYLLSKPSTVPHPSTRASLQTTAVLPIGSANYNTIASWISTGC